MNVQHEPFGLPCLKYGVDLAVGVFAYPWPTSLAAWASRLWTWDIVHQGGAFPTRTLTIRQGMHLACYEFDLDSCNSGFPVRFLNIFFFSLGCLGAARAEACVQDFKARKDQLMSLGRWIHYRSFS